MWRVSTRCYVKSVYVPKEMETVNNGDTKISRGVTESGEICSEYHATFLTWSAEAIGPQPGETYETFMLYMKLWCSCGAILRKLIKLLSKAMT